MIELAAVCGFDDAIDQLSLNWARPEWTRDLLAHYERRLRDVPDGELVAAVDRLVNTHTTWRPDVAQIRATVVGLRGLFPSEGEAARQAAEYTQVRRLYDANGSLPVGVEFPVVHPVVRDAARAAGTDLHAAFRKAYAEAVVKATTAIQAGDLGEPVIFTPVRVVGAHVPPRLVWLRHAGTAGWYTPAGVLVHGDPGDHRAGLLPAGVPLALPFSPTG